MNLIHMNGRVYDPSLGRFLSVDPVFEFPTNTQSLNSYSYVLNNPLSMMDPTGYAASACSDGSSTACPDQDGHDQMKVGDTKYASHTATGTHIADIASATKISDSGGGTYALSSNNPQMAQTISKAFSGGGAQNPNTGASGADLGKTAQDGSLAQNTGSVTANANAVTGVPVVLPNGANAPDAYSPTGNLMSPVADLKPVAEAGAKTLANYTLLKLTTNQVVAFAYRMVSLKHHVGQNGKFDFQRSGGKYLSQFRDVANFNVGLFAHMAGFSLRQTMEMASAYARFKSNFGKAHLGPNGLPPETETFIKLGYSEADKY